MVTVEQVCDWLDDGDVGHLEHLILQGKAFLIEGKESLHPKTNAFLKILPIYKHKIDALLEAIYLGDESTVAALIDYKRLLYARHPFSLGSTVHLAVIHDHPNILRLLLSKPHAPLNARDMVCYYLLELNGFLI